LECGGNRSTKPVWMFAWIIQSAVDASTGVVSLPAHSK